MKFGPILANKSRDILIFVDVTWQLTWLWHDILWSFKQMMIYLLTEYGTCRTSRGGFFQKYLWKNYQEMPVKKSLKNTCEKILKKYLWKNRQDPKNPTPKTLKTQNYFKWNKLQTKLYFSKEHTKKLISKSWKSEKEGHTKREHQNYNFYFIK